MASIVKIGSSRLVLTVVKTFSGLSRPGHGPTSQDNNARLRLTAAKL